MGIWPKLATLLARRGAIRKRPAPPSGDPWPTGGDPTRADASGSFETIVQAATNGTSGNKTTVLIPPGVYRETVNITNKSNLRIMPETPNTVEVRATDKWTSWTNMGDGTWRSTNTIPSLTIEARWQFEGITRIDADYPAGSNPTTINVLSTADLSVGQYVNIGFDNSVCVGNYELRYITAKGSNAQGPTITLNAALTQGHFLNPENFGKNAQCVDEIAHGSGGIPEQVYKNGPSERAGGQTLKRVGISPGANEFMIDTSRRVIVGFDPTGHVIEVTTRNTCIDLGTGANDITIEGMSCLYSGSNSITGGDRLRPTITKCEVGYAHTKGITTGGSTDATVTFNHLHHCGHLGFSNPNTGHVIFANNHVEYCNNMLFRTGWEAGGIKISNCPSAAISDNHIHDNFGHGIWLDVETVTQAITIDRDRVHHNARQGIRVEATHGVTMTGVISYENGFDVLHDKLLEFNVTIVGSFDVTLQDSIIAWGGDGGVLCAPQDHPDRDDMHNVHVNNCIIVMQENDVSPYGVRWRDSTGGGTPFPFLLSQNNTSSGNRFAFTDASGTIVAETPTGTPTRRYEWEAVNYHRIADYNASNAQPAGTTDSTLLTQQQLTTELTAAGVNLVPEPF